MAAPLTFVIPVLNEAPGIAALLEQLARDYPAAERIVVDGGSDDDTLRLATGLADRVLGSEAGRARQMNGGAAAASGEYLFFLHADTRPTLAQAQLLQALAREPAWGFSPVRLSGAAPAFRIIEWFINRRSALTGVGTGDQMIFVRREAFNAIGGFDDIPLMEDVALCKRLRRHARPQLLAEPVVTSSRRWEQDGVVRTVLLMWRLRLAYFLGASPQRLWRQYHGR